MKRNFIICYVLWKKWASHVIRVEKTRNLCKLLVWTPKKKTEYLCDLLADEQVELDLK